MTEQVHPEGDGVSRRNLIVGGLGAVAGVSALVSSLPGGSIAVAQPLHPASLRPEALGAALPALTYIGIDAVDFFPPQTNNVHARYNDDTSGTGVLTPGDSLQASLPIPSGSVIHQFNIAYQGTPIINVFKRSMTAPSPPAQFVSTSLAPGGLAKTQTINLDGSTALLLPITIEATSTYSLRFYCGAGDSIYGVTVGYLPPTQSFIPFVGTPRVLDTRTTGGKLAPGEERTIALGFPGARSAVINLTVADTEGNGGFVAVFPANIAWPNNSSINWSGPNEFVANGVISALDPGGQIKIRGGSQKTNVVIDRIGWLI